MRINKFTTILLVSFAVGGLSWPAAAKSPTPIIVARQFYRWNIEQRRDTYGLPSDKQIKAIQGLLDSTLSKAVRQAKTVETCLIKLTPAGDKPLSLLLIMTVTFSKIKIGNCFPVGTLGKSSMN
jgi:hypothetical protein